MSQIPNDKSKAEKHKTCKNRKHNTSNLLILRIHCLFEIIESLVLSENKGKEMILSLCILLKHQKLFKG